jgi:hypothetical protein
MWATSDIMLYFVKKLLTISKTNIAVSQLAEHGKQAKHARDKIGKKPKNTIRT